MILNSNEYEKVVNDCPVINLHILEDVFNVRIPYNVTGYRLYDLLEVSCSPMQTISFEGVMFDGLHPWVDIPTENLNRINGKHVYKLSFMNERTNNYINVYISYIIQDDNPQKDYIYMSNRYTEDDEDKESIYL